MLLYCPSLLLFWSANLFNFSFYGVLYGYAPGEWTLTLYVSIY